MKEKIVLIDTDAGLDDTLAIIMALKAHQHPSIPFRIVGITCVHGNTTLQNVTMNVTSVLDKLMTTDVPVYRGAAHPMVNPSAHHSKARHHGSNGFGDVDESVLKRSDPKLELENAVAAIIRLVNEFPGHLTIVALGPLTNLALAVRTDDRIKHLVKEIFIMGGSSEGSKIHPLEFNFVSDPESVHVTFTTFSCPITIAPKELGERIVAQTPDWRLNVLGNEDTPECKFMNLIEKSTFEEGGRVKELGTWRPFDSTIMASLIEPAVIRKAISHPVSIELQDSSYRGHMSIDFSSSEQSNVQIITDMDVELFQKMLIWTMNSAKFFK